MSGNGKTLPTTVTYLEMTAKPTTPPPPSPMMKCALLRAADPPVHFYRYLYNTVGRDYFWIERRLWDDKKLADLLADPKLALYVLYLDGVPAGFSELDMREDPKTTLVAYFGLMPNFTGRRIGPWLLRQTIDLAWSAPISRLVVSTCTLDHPRALSIYQRAGFVPYARSEKQLVIPPEHAGDFPLSSPK